MKFQFMTLQVLICSNLLPNKFRLSRLHKTKRGSAAALPFTSKSIRQLISHFTKSSKSLDEIDISKVKKLIAVDSTWQQCKAILRDPKMQGLPTVRIRTEKTKFWRYQNHGEDHLATVEGN